MSATVFAFLAATAAQPAAALPPAPPAAKERRICKTFERTESRLRPNRICKTAEEWRLDSELAQKHLEDVQREAVKN